MNALIPPLVDGLFSKLKEALDGSIVLNATESAGECCKFGDFGGRVSAYLGGFFISPINEKQVSISATPGPIFPSNSIRLNVNTGKIKAGFSEVGLAASFAAIFPVQCSLFAAVDAEIDSILLVLDLYSNPSNTSAFSFRTSEFRIGGLSFSFEPMMDDKGFCSVVAEFISIIFRLLSATLKRLFIERINDFLVEFAINQLPTSKFQTPQIPPLNITKNNTLALDYKVPTFFVETDSIVVVTSLDLEASLYSPSWREGYKRTQPYNSGKSFPDPPKSNLINAFIGADGLNNVFAMLWYLLWADIVTDEASIDSPLCEPTTNDPCPIPPFREEFTMGDKELWAFLPLGLYKSIFVNAVINPPVLNFETGSLVSGTMSSNLILEGRTLIRPRNRVIADVTAEINFDSAQLEYNPDSGVFSGLQIKDFSVGDIQLNYAYRPARRISMNVILNMVERIINRLIANRLLDMVNGAIIQAVSAIPQLPVIPNFPMPGDTLFLNLTEVTMTGISETESTQSVAYLGADLAIRIESNSTATNSSPAFNNETTTLFKRTKTDMRPTLQQTILIWAEESAGNSNAFFSWSFQDTDLGIMEVHHYQYDEFLELVEFEDENFSI